MSNYNREEHEKFLQKVKENPQNYDFEGSHYPNAKATYPDGSMGVGHGVPRDEWSYDWMCPECGSNQIHQRTLGGHPWVECESCGWIGGNKEEDCTNESKINQDCTNESKINQDRFEKLNDILSLTIIG